MFLLENKELFNLQTIPNEIIDNFKQNYEKYLQYQVVSPSTCNEESMFSIFKHHYHTNASNEKIESTTTISFETIDIGSSNWFYEKRFHVEEYYENLERKRSENN